MSEETIENLKEQLKEMTESKEMYHCFFVKEQALRDKCEERIEMLEGVIKLLLKDMK